MSQERKIDRRRFLERAVGTITGAIGFPYIVKSSVFGANGTILPSERIVMGCIGVGSMGGGHLRSLLSHLDVRVVAACDVREMFRSRAKSRIDEQYGDKACVVYNDFRELCARKDIDAVLIATPEHWHVLIALEAARNKKDMYCEKPMGMSIAQTRALQDAVNRNGVVFQFGTQQRSDDRFRFACELARNGRLGKLHTIMVGSYPSGPFPNQPTEPMPDKKEFDYDMWLGPAPWAPYSFQRCASRAQETIGAWTLIYDYSLGGLGGAWGIHHVDIAQWGNGTDDTGPIEVEGTGVFPEDGLADTAVAWDVRHKYANGVTMIHMDTKAALERAEQFKLNGGRGILFIGSEGWVLVDREIIKAHPESLLTATIGPDEIRLPRSKNHTLNFLDCVRSRQKTICPVDVAAHSDIICHLDDIAMRLGRKLRWDPDKEQFINDEQANRMMSRPMRSPWHL